MGFWTTLFKARSEGTAGHQQDTVKGKQEWHYEESRDFSKSQSTVRIDQRRPGDWELLQPSCGIVGLNDSGRRDGVSRFFEGSYRWLRLERGVDSLSGEKLVKVIGTSQDKRGRESAVHLGFLKQELGEELEGEKIGNLWGKIRFIKFPSSGRSSGYLIRFDLMKKRTTHGSSNMVK